MCSRLPIESLKRSNSLYQQRLVRRDNQGHMECRVRNMANPVSEQAVNSARDLWWLELLVMVGIDGKYGSNDVLQAGIQQQVTSNGDPSYVAWYEWFAPQQSNSPPYMRIQAGDRRFCFGRRRKRRLTGTKGLPGEREHVREEWLVDISTELGTQKWKFRFRRRRG